MLSAGDLAQRFKLGTDLLLNTVRARLGSTIHGQLEGQLLYTPAYVARIKAQVGRRCCAVGSAPALSGGT